jgi:hypothetical protein
VSWLTPVVSSNLASRTPFLSPREAIHIERALKMVEFVLKNPSEPPLGGDLEGGLLGSCALKDDSIRSHQGKTEVRD